MEKRQSFQQTVLGKLNSYLKKKKKGLDHFLTAYTKVNSKWIKDLNGRPETIKILENNIDSNLFNINHSSIFLDLSPLARETKAKLNYWYCTKNKKILHSKENNKTKRQTLNERSYC